MLPTADISDKYSDSVRILKPLFRDYGGVKSFSGKVKTIKTLDDNTKVRSALESEGNGDVLVIDCLLYTSPSPRDGLLSRMPSSA